MVAVHVCSKLKASWKTVVFTNKDGKNSRYFVGVFNKTIIPLALVRYELVIANEVRCASLAINLLISNANSWKNLLNKHLIYTYGKKQGWFYSREYIYISFYRYSKIWSFFFVTQLLASKIEFIYRNGKIINLNTLISMCIFSTLFPIHFLPHWWAEFV